MALKPTQTLQQLLVALVTSWPCLKSYIGETERSLKTRFLEHLVVTLIWTKSKSLDQEPWYFERGVKEAIYIRVNKPSLNKDGDRYKLPRMLDPIFESSVQKVTDT